MFVKKSQFTGTKVTNHQPKRIIMKKYPKCLKPFLNLATLEAIK